MLQNVNLFARAIFFVINFCRLHLKMHSDSIELTAQPIVHIRVANHPKRSIDRHITLS